LHCCENALLVYNQTYEEILEQQRRLLYKSLASNYMLWDRVGAIPIHGSKRDKFVPRRRPESAANVSNKSSLVSDRSSRLLRVVAHDADSSSIESDALASFKRKLKSDRLPLSRLTRKMILSALSTEIGDPLQNDGGTCGSSTHGEFGSRVPRDHQHLESNTLLPSLIITDTLIRQLESLSRA
jgi:hypothetical protein